MTAFAQTLTQNLGSFDWARNLRTSTANALAARRTYRTTRDELMSLSDRDLADLGLSRSMIDSVARDAAYGK